MKQGFLSIRTKFLLLLGYFLLGLTALVFTEAYFDNARERLEHRNQGSLQLGEYSGKIQYLVKATQTDLHKLVFRGDTELENRILANNEDLLTEFDGFSQAAQEHGFDEDYFFLLENESVLLGLRADIFQAVASHREGQQQQAQDLLIQKIEPNIFHLESFISSTNEIRRLEIADYRTKSEQLKTREQTLESVVAWAVFLIGLVIALFMSRSIIRPIESLTRQVRNLESDKNWETRMVSTSNDESRILTEAFNTLLKGYAKAEKALASHNEILAATVKKRTQELLAAQEKLIKKDRLAVLGQVTGMVSHELRNPLGTIKASMYTLHKRLTGHTVETDHIVERINRNVRRCDNIVDELLIFSRTRKLNLAEVDFDAWLDDLLDEYALPERLTLRRDLDSNAAVSIDREYMYGVFTNLLNNAAEAMSPEGGAIRPGSEIRVSTRQLPGQLMCELEDNGPGMSEEVLNQVFEPLFTTKGFGVGLGMTVVKRTVEQHGGQLELDTGPGQGTRCIIRFNLHGG